MVWNGAGTNGANQVRKFRLSEHLAVKWAHADIADNRLIQSHTAATIGTVSDYAPGVAHDHVLARLITDLAHKALCFAAATRLPYAGRTGE